MTLLNSICRTAAIAAIGFGLGLAAPDADAKSRGFRMFHTYTKPHPSGKIYTGRTSGGDKPAKVIRNRDAGHHMNKQGYGPAQLDRSSSNKSAIRGREQQLIDKHKAEGRSGNAINGVSPKNPRREHYLSEAEKEFGKP